MNKKEASEGVIKAFYTLNGWFVKVKQCYEIDKVCFSFVKKGTKGDGFDVYVNVDLFDNLCDDIITGAFRQALMNDTGQYPSAWKTVSGKNGQKEIVIGSGQRQPIVIQGRDKSGQKNAFVGVMDYDELRTMAKWHRRVSKAYYEGRAADCAAAQIHKPKTISVTLWTSGPPERKGNIIRIPALHQDGSAAYIYLNRQSMDYLGNMQDKFLQSVSQGRVAVSMEAMEKGNNYLLAGNLSVRQG